MLVCGREPPRAVSPEVDPSETPPVRIRRIRIGASFVLSRYRG
ncbi:unnamed protein product [Brassica oleracea]|uniref:(rape) hypothetical protein n=1 Tax=Brassica napus TaxID=3708 RepID=A0A816KF67_BRANA|nr:unnamed protein product [Brassica napus]